MTTIASFATISQHSKKIYLISDSRVSWPITSNPKFDNSTKLFPFRNSPDIMAYCGDSLFSLSVLSRIKIQLEFYHKYCTSANALHKKDIVLSYLNTSISHYPKELLNDDITITHFMALDNIFYGFKYSFNHKTSSVFDVDVINIPSTTGIIDTSGSGGKSYITHLADYTRKYEKHAYTMFFAFLSFIKSGIDKKTGGPPQLVQLASNGQVKPIGIFIDNKINLLGETNTFWDNEFSIEIRSEFFELVNSDGEKLSNEKDRSYLKYITWS